MVHFERLLVIERESEDIHSLANDQLDICEKKWGKCITVQD